MKKSAEFSNIETALPECIPGDDEEWFVRPIVVVGKDARLIESTIYIPISNVDFEEGHVPNIIIKFNVQEDCKETTEVLTQYCTLGKELSEVADDRYVKDVTHNTKQYQKEAFTQEDWDTYIRPLLSEE